MNSFVVARFKKLDGDLLFEYSHVAEPNKTLIQLSEAEYMELAKGYPHNTHCFETNQFVTTKIPVRLG